MTLHSIHQKRVVRGAAIAVLGVALIATAVRIDEVRQDPAPVTVSHAANPLDAELQRCRNIVRPEDVDDACRAAWSEAQRRFFETREARP